MGWNNQTKIVRAKIVPCTHTSPINANKCNLEREDGSFAQYRIKETVVSKKGETNGNK